MGKEFSNYELNRTLQYLLTMRPVLKKRGLFHDGTEYFRSPMEPEAGDTVRIRFRTAINDADRVWYVSGDERKVMKKAFSKGNFDYYEIEIDVGESNFRYCFEICNGYLYCYYDRCGVTKIRRPEYEFEISPGFSTPKWAKGAVMYQILVDRFYNGDESNSPVDNEYFYIRTGSKKIEKWHQVPSNFSVAEFYGGDLEGIRKKLDYLEDLGVEAIYLNPIFVSPSNHKYDAQDYDYVDPHYGKIVVDGGEVLEEGETDNRKATKYKKRVTTKENLEASNELFAKVVSEAHSRGIKVIIDGVFNHCGSFHKWIDREGIYEGEEGYEVGAYQSKESPYNSYFGFGDKGAWPNNGTYEGWWGHDTLPKLNYDESEELFDYILKVGKKWVSPPYNVDGWRLDVAADLGHSAEVNHKFWRRFREEVKKANPNAIILAEHYGDASSWLEGDQWDTIMNYSAFMEPLTYYLTGMEKHSDSSEPGLINNLGAFENSMNHFMTNFLTPSLLCSMNQLSNHDHSRFLTRTNHVVGRIDSKGAEAASEGVSKPVLKEAVVCLMTWPGAPTLYYGDEAGQVGFTDPDNRRTYPWGKEDLSLIDFHRDMIRIHKEFECLKTGSLKILKPQGNYLCYGRFGEHDRVVVMINNTSESIETKQSVWALEIPMNCELTRVMVTAGDNYSVAKVPYAVKEGKIEILLPPFSAVVLAHRD